MKNFSKTVLATAIAAASITASTTAQAGFSANVGLVSDYFFRGIDQGTSATGSAGLDFEHGGFYVGTWAADVSDGLEVDGYFGYGLELGDFSIGAGFTGYYYTGDFDDDYEEINLTAGYGPVSVEYTIGEYDTDPETQDYTFAAVTVEHNGFYGTYGTFGDDFDGDYFEVGYGTTISDIDYGVAIIFNDEDLSSTDESDESLVFSIGKSFDL